MWLHNKIASVNYVIVVCSAGARFKSVTTRVAQLEEVSCGLLSTCAFLGLEFKLKLVVYGTY